MKNIFSTRKRIVIAGAAASAVILGTGGAAYAYFAASGTGTGSATVGAAGTWTVSAGTETGTGPLYPDGTSSETIVFTVTNDSSGQQEFTSASAVMGADGNGFATVNNNPIGNCYASWFTPSISADPSLSKEIAGGGNTTVTVTVTMPTDETDNQTACAGQSPDVTLKIA